MQDEQGSLDAYSETCARSAAFVSAAPLHQQYFARSSATAADGPEKRLLFAVLLNAILQLRSRHVDDIIEAENWIRANETGDSPFSFDSICEGLSIDSSYLARGLLTWCSRQRPGLPRSPLRQIRASRTRIAPNRERSRPTVQPPL